MSADPYSYDERFSESDGPEKQPPQILLVVGLVSVLFGTLVGVYGLVSRTSLSTSQQFGLGASGYLLTAFLPIVLLVLIDHKNKAALESYQHQQYNIYAGKKLMDSFKRVVGLGMLCASFSIIVFFLPIAQEFAK